jgi:hypothetical protein
MADFPNAYVAKMNIAPSLNGGTPTPAAPGPSIGQGTMAQPPASSSLQANPLADAKARFPGGRA